MDWYAIHLHVVVVLLQGRHSSTQRSTRLESLKGMCTYVWTHQHGRGARQQYERDWLGSTRKYCLGLQSENLVRRPDQTGLLF